jgi:hypothetical protein
MLTIPTANCKQKSPEKLLEFPLVFVSEISDECLLPILSVKDFFLRDL